MHTHVQLLIIISAGEQKKNPPYIHGTSDHEAISLGGLLLLPRRAGRIDNILGDSEW